MSHMPIGEASEDLGPLKDRLATIDDLNSAASVLAWDRQTYMPEGGVGGRAEQLASLARIAHEMLASDETGRLLEDAEQAEPGSDDAAILRVATREYDRAIRLPARLVAETSRATALADPAWVQARERSDWSMFAPHLERVLALKLEAAGYLDGAHPYDAMLDRYDPGSSTQRLRIMFDELKAGIVPLVREVSAIPAEDGVAPLRGAFDKETQDSFGRDVITSFGYDWSRGRQDPAVHPFCISFGGPGDVRMTTRFDPIYCRSGSSAPATRRATPSTSRASIPRSHARLSRAGSRWVFTSPSRACGRTWSPVRGRSGLTSIPDYRTPSRML
jgi:carboxypeptidase Taq